MPLHKRKLGYTEPHLDQAALAGTGARTEIAGQSLATCVQVLRPGACKIPAS